MGGIGPILSIAIAVMAGMALAVAPAVAQPEDAPDDIAEPVPRLALVIGIQDYDYLDDVDNAVSDAAVVGTALGRAGFSLVRAFPDLPHAEFMTQLRSFAERVRAVNGPVIVAFYFSGHGYQVGSFDYLAARDLPEGGTLDEKRAKSVSLNTVLSMLSTHDFALPLVLIDACRNKTSVGDSQLPPGFAVMSAPSDSLISFASSFDRPANSFVDETDLNSPYAAAVGTHLTRPGIAASAMLEAVRLDVSMATERVFGAEQAQKPVLLNEMSGTFYFVATDRETTQEAEEWRATRTQATRDSVKRFVKSHPGSSYSKAAVEWLEERQ